MQLPFHAENLKDEFVIQVLLLQIVTAE